MIFLNMFGVILIKLNVLAYMPSYYCCISSFRQAFVHNPQIAKPISTIFILTNLETIELV